VKKLLIAAVAVLLLVVAFVGGYFVAGGAAPSTASLPAISPGASPAGEVAGAPKDGKPAADAGKAPGAATPDPAKPNDGGAGTGAAPDKAAGGPPAAAVPVRPAQVVPSKDKEETRYAIEFGAFRSAENAQLFAAALAERGLPVEIVESLDAAGMTWSRVWAGAFADRWQAEARLGGYERMAGLGGVVVSEPKGPAAGAKTDAKPEAVKTDANE
jgi:cell division protein FtsN